MGSTSSKPKGLGKIVASTVLLAWYGLFFDRDILSQTLAEQGILGTERCYRQAFWRQKVLRFNANAPCPVAPSTAVSRYDHLSFTNGQVRNLLSPGCYFQNFGAPIIIGRDVYIAPNVGLITANHDLDDLASHAKGEAIRIGDHVWIGMNAVILPGVSLGPGTVVGAGAVVTRSDHGGDCRLLGSPARCRVHRGQV